MSRYFYFFLILAILVSTGCKKERDPREYLEGTLVTFSGPWRTGCNPPLTILAVSYRSVNEIKYFARDLNGVMLNDLSQFEIKRIDK